MELESPRGGSAGRRRLVATDPTIMCMEPTWHDKDKPVLAAAVQYFEEHDYQLLPEADDLAAIVGLEAIDVGKALIRLDGEYLRVGRTMGGLEKAFIQEIYPSARRAVGQWPTSEDFVNRILAGFQAAAESEADTSHRSKLKDTAEFLGSDGKDLLIDLVASVMAKSTGLR